MKSTAAYYVMTLGLSSLTFGLIFGGCSFFIMFGDLIIALITSAIAFLYGVVMYGLFAFPLQMILQKKAKTFNVMHLLIYIVHCHCFYRSFPAFCYRLS